MSQEHIIGVIANNPDQFHVARDLITTSDFTDESCCQLWQAIGRVIDKGLPITTSFIKKEAGEYYADVYQLIKDRTFGNDVEPYCKATIADNRDLLFQSAVAQALSKEDPVSFLQSAIDRYNTVATNQSETFKQLISKTVDFIESVGDGDTGIKTGLHCIDSRIGGLQKDRVMVVAARTAVGKTALTMQFALHAASQGVGVGVCSLEMGSHELGVRAIAHTCKANVSGLYRADDTALGFMTQGMGRTNLANWKMHFNVEQYRLNEIVNQIRVWVRKEDIKLAIVDHIGLVEVPEATSANERLGMVTRAMKKLCKELHIPIILVSQLNRGNDKENRHPRLSDLRDSGSIEQDADIVLLMHRVVDPNTGAYIKHDLALAKNRQGPAEPIHDAVITFNGQHQVFEEQHNG